MGPFKNTYARKGGGVSTKAYEKMYKGEGALLRPYVCSCNFQTVITCEA